METRIVWITLLAMAGKDGVAEASVPGLADFARVPVEKTEAALAKLSAPDTYSRSKEYEGRRIIEVDGGWLLVNHAKYRAKLGEIERREYKRLKQAHYREQQVSTVDNCGQCSPNVDTVDTKQKQKQKQKQVEHVPAVPAVDDGFDAFWKAYPKKRDKGHAAKCWMKMKPSPDLQVTILASIAVQRTWRDWTKDNGDFIPHPTTWLNGQGWANEETTTAPARPLRGDPMPPGILRPCQQCGAEFAPQRYDDGSAMRIFSCPACQEHARA